LAATHHPGDVGVFSVRLRGAIDLPEEPVLTGFLQDFRDGHLPSARVDLRQVTFMTPPAWPSWYGYDERIWNEAARSRSWARRESACKPWRSSGSTPFTMVP